MNFRDTSGVVKVYQPTSMGVMELGHFFCTYYIPVYTYDGTTSLLYNLASLCSMDSIYYTLLV